MGIFSLASSLTCTTAAYIYPAYASYKALKTNDPPALERWLMYWVIIGAVASVENTVEWVIDWFPFYYEVKAVFILWLASPQVQGSTYVYTVFVHPFLTKHEHEIDAAIGEAKASAYAAGLGYVNRAVVWVRELIMGSVLGQGQQSQSQEPAYQQPPPAYAGGPQPGNTAAGAAGGFAGLAGQLARRYGPAAVAAAQNVLNPMAGREASSASYAAADRSVRESYAARPTHDRASSSASRREELERELADLMQREGASGTSTGSNLFPGSAFHSRSASGEPAATASARERRTSSSSYGGSTPRDPVAERFESSLLGQSGYETIRHEDARGSESGWRKTTSGIVPVPSIQVEGKSPGSEQAGWGRWMWGGGPATPGEGSGLRSKRD